MTIFEDGPAKGQHMMLGRAPVFLRVVLAGAKWDALDQLGDTPAPGEVIHVYRRNGTPGRCHIYKSGGGSGFYTIARYLYFPEQPPDAALRDTGAWRKWCLLHQ